MKYEEYCQDLEQNPKKWLITGVAGFIGSNLLKKLLELNQYVIGLDNLETGLLKNLNAVSSASRPDAWKRFTFINGDICELKTCIESCADVDIVLHQAALGSVPRSIENPLRTNEVNINGFLNMLVASRDSNIERFIYAASSSTYGDHPDLPKVEDKIGKPLSPYAITKYVNELYADVFKKTYDIDTIGLRYFNVFGPRQNPEGAYAAVIPKWISSMIRNERVNIFGDGRTSRDFCYIDNVVQANILAAGASKKEAVNEIYNIAVNDSNSLNELFKLIVENLKSHNVNYKFKPLYSDFRDGDVRHSMADINKAKSLLGYEPKYNLKEGIADAMPWYLENLKN